MTRRTHFDLIVIGAGINGAGIARDAALRGLSVLVLEKGDIANGTSSWSTRLIHGGLRYLEHFEFGLVRESLHERENLLRIAPHLVKPIPILMPIYKNAIRGSLTLRIGMLAYDFLSLGKTLPSHQILSRAQTLAKFPSLNASGLVSGAIYYDCQVEFAERLVVENILAAKQDGAEVETYSRVTKLSEGEVQFVRRRSESIVIATAKLIINAAGPWVDQLLATSTEFSGKRLIGGTKGSHIVVKSFPGASSTAIYVEAESDGRPFFVIPWNDNYLIGTTDIRFDGNLDEVRSDEWEIRYLLNETNRVLPEANLGIDDVCYCYSGVRPLPFTTNADAKSITRRHFIHEHEKIKNLFSIVGGKLSTYRSLAEECVDLVFTRLGRQSPHCSTNELPLPGAMPMLDPANEHSDKILMRLTRIYGSNRGELAKLCVQTPELSRTFNQDRNAIGAEIVYAFQSESATTLADCLLRRTMLGLNSDLAIGDDFAAAEIGREFLGWSEQRANDEVAQYRREIDRMLIK